MANTSYTLDQPHLLPSSVMAVDGEPPTALRRRYNRITLGFWLGGVVLGTVGCLVGASLSYYHLAARVISVLWWGIYFGCLGACLGALPGLFLERSLTRRRQPPQDAESPATEPHRVDPACSTELTAAAAVLAVSKSGSTRCNSSCCEQVTLFPDP